MEKEDKMYRELLDNNLVSEDTLDMITNIFGYNQKVLRDILEYQTGDNEFEFEIEDEDEEI